MAKMPENDNLVMESIEDLFNQADSVSTTKGNVTPHLEREQIENLPIIGAHPVNLEKNMPATESILVLAGQKRPISDQAGPLFSVKPQIEDISPPQATETPTRNPESENPFLAIRQAVISAGDADSDAGRSREDKKTDDAAAPQKDRFNQGRGENVSGHSSFSKALSERNFTDQIAQLIDNEIEVRLKAQLSIFALADHPAKATTPGEEKSKKTSPARKTAAKRASASKKTQAPKKQAAKAKAAKAKAAKTQKKSLKRAAAPAPKRAKEAPLKKTAKSKAVTGKKKSHTNKKIASLKKNAPAKKKS